MIKRAPRPGRHRIRLPKTYQPLIADLAATLSIASAKLRVTTTIPMVISGIPTGITVQGVAPTAVTQVSSTVFDLTYAASVVTTNVAVIPAGVSQVRGNNGGSLAAATVTL